MKPLNPFICFPIRTAALVGALWFTATVAPASTMVPAAPQNHPILLTGGTVHPVSGAVLEKADVLLVDGRIAAIGADLKAPVGVEVVRVDGKHVYPGLIAACTKLGLFEVEAVRATVDVAETGSLNPNVRAQVAINPDSERIPIARSNGVLTALTVPSAQPDLIAGLSALIRLDGWTWEDLSLRPAAALHIVWPDLAIDRSPQAAKKPEDQQKAIDLKLRKLDEAFAAARAYAQARTAAAGRPAPDTDLRWEAMVPVFEGKLPVFVHADEARQIEAALAWARQQQLSITLVGGADAALFATELHDAGVPVILTGTQILPRRRDDGFDTPFATPEVLRQAGVKFCIAGSQGSNNVGNERNVGYEAAKAVGYGLPHDEALKAVTLYAAQVLGMGDELGSLEAGKRATLIVTNGDPLEIPTQVEIAYIDGRRIDLNNRQHELYEKYRKRAAK
ncbi:MAG TPA: amidohydrolase family protein [Lacunisphaera sp.]|nr:amidohydrolase family protein [Lacunisphaera sp.]